MKAFLSSLSRSKRYVVAELFLVYFAQGLSSIMLGSVLPDLRAAYALDYQIGGTQTRVPHPVLCIRGRLCHAADQRLAGLAAGGHVPDRHFQGRYHGLQQPRNE